MIVPNREIVNLNIFSSSSAISNTLEFNAISEDIQMDAPRDRTIKITESGLSFLLFSFSFLFSF